MVNRLLTILKHSCASAGRHIAQALTPFGQVANASNKRQVGTGLGLPIAKSLTKLLGGRFVVESEIGRGTRVKVTLPFAPLEADPRKPETAAEKDAPLLIHRGSTQSAQTSRKVVAS
jgi:hypothetical protein